MFLHSPLNIAMLVGKEQEKLMNRDLARLPTFSISV